MTWIERKVQNPDLVQQLSHVLNDLPLPLARALVLRGIDSFETARTYFRATLEETHDPWLLQTMEEAASRLARAIQSQERVLVYGDFDVDGVTSTTLVVDFLRSRGTQVDYFIPSRLEDGHGFHERGVKTALAQNATLIVVVDCGTSATETAALARKHRLDIIICDHHENTGVNPPSVAHINPKRNGCTYPFKELSACGLAYKMAVSTCELLNEPPETTREYLDLVALSTVCDVMPLHDENRILVREGLEVLRSTTRYSLQALMNVAGVEPSEIRSNDIAMRLGPHLNAAGRLAHAGLAVELLLEKNFEQAFQLAFQLGELNTKRKGLGKEIETTASKLARTQLAGAHPHALVLHDPEWHPGVLGPVANRIVEAFGRPTILLTNDPQDQRDAETRSGLVVGSARSVEGLDIHDALASCRDLLTKFGGHAQAAGLSIPAVDIPVLRERLNAYVRTRIDTRFVVTSTGYDAKLAATDINQRFVNVLKQCEPFGKNNEEPLFCIPDLHVVSVRTTRTGEHLSLTFKAPGKGRQLDAIAFWHGDKLIAMEEARIQQLPVELLCRVTENTFNGRTRLQLRVEALRTADIPSSPNNTCQA